MSFNEGVLVEIVRLFIDRPDSSGTAEGIALHLGKSPQEVKPVLESLVQAEVLKEEVSDELKVYQYIPPMAEGIEQGAKGREQKLSML